MSGTGKASEKQGTLFEERFLGRYAGAIMSDPTTALVELVANAWDAYATKVDIIWPGRETPFSVTDNGIGMTPAEFEVRWRTLDYDRAVHQGLVAVPPPGVQGQPRPVFGRNGKGRLAAFYFSSPYRVRTWRDGTEVTYLVSQGRLDPIKFDLAGSRKNVSGHGTEISAVHSVPSFLQSHDARSILSTRFLTNPDFRVSVDGGGAGGSTTAGTGGAAQTWCWPMVGAGGGASSVTGSGGSGGSVSKGAGGGAAEGGIDTAGIQRPGGPGGYGHYVGEALRRANGGVGGTAGNGGSGGSGKAWDRGAGGGGGGGGAGTAAANGGIGGPGGAPAGGGGGGGGTRGNATSGAGGNGGRGEVWIVAMS